MSENGDVIQDEIWFKDSTTCTSSVWQSTVSRQGVEGSNPSIQAVLCYLQCGLVRELTENSQSKKYLWNLEKNNIC